MSFLLAVPPSVGVPRPRQGASPVTEKSTPATPVSVAESLLASAIGPSVHTPLAASPFAIVAEAAATDPRRLCTRTRPRPVIEAVIDLDAHGIRQRDPGSAD